LVEKAKSDINEARFKDSLHHFEKRYPFYRLDLEAYLGRVKRFVLTEQDGKVRMSQLIYAFEKLPTWKELGTVDSPIREFILCDFFRPEGWVAPNQFEAVKPLGQGS
jgi:hypothetical protein